MSLLAVTCRWLRLAGVLTLAAAGTVAVRLLAGPVLARLVDGTGSTGPRHGPTLTEVVLAACATLVALCWTWLLACVVVTVAEVLTATALPTRAWVPRAVRVVVIALLGSAALASPALADPGSVPVPHLDGLRVPDRVRTVTPVVSERTVHVRPGDCLWTIAARLLAPGAPDAAVDVAWRRLAKANSGRLGADPDLIFPGTTLRVPAALTHLGEEPS